MPFLEERTAEELEQLIAEPQSALVLLSRAVWPAIHAALLTRLRPLMEPRLAKLSISRGRMCCLL